MKKAMLNFLGKHKWQRIFRLIVFFAIISFMIYHAFKIFPQINIEKGFELFFKILLILGPLILLSFVINYLDKISNTSWAPSTGHKQRICTLLKECFFSNPIQSLWTDILAFSISIGLLFSMNFKDKVYRVFVMWDIIAICMSLLLTALYMYDVFYKKDAIGAKILGPPENNNLNVRRILKLVIVILFSATPLFIAIIALLMFEDNYFWMLVMLCLAGLVFIAIDYLLLHYLENTLGDALEKDIDDKKFSLKFANIPAFLGLSLILTIYCLFTYYMNLHEGINGFIAGGSAMHMVFGNIIVAAQLGR